MTNSLKETNTRVSGTEPVGSPPKPGAQAPHAELSGSAGVATNVAPRQLTVSEIFEVLAKAIAEFESSGKVATAAGVSARMRQISPGFSVSSTEFASFRDITRAAESAGLILATRTSSDYVLKLVGDHDQDFRGATLRPDLWRAIQDWTEGVRYAFNRGTQKTEPIGASLPVGSVAVPTVAKSTSVQWMREFSATQRGDLAMLLTEALNDKDPIAGFHRVTQENGSIKRRWSKYLRTRVLDTAVTWATSNSIPRSEIFTSSVSMNALSAPKAQVKEAADISGDIDARQRVLDILESMPLHELLRLPIPLEYSLKR